MLKENKTENFQRNIAAQERALKGSLFPFKWFIFSFNLKLRSSWSSLSQFFNVYVRTSLIEELE